MLTFVVVMMLTDVVVMIITIESYFEMPESFDLGRLRRLSPHRIQASRAEDRNSRAGDF